METHAQKKFAERLLTKKIEENADSQTTMFQSAVISFMDYINVFHTDMQEIQQMFKLIDTNGDGRLSLEEINNSLNSMEKNQTINHDTAVMIKNKLK